MAAIVLAIVVINFFLIHAAPGDPASVIAGQSGAADPQFIEQLRQQFGLDKPLLEQLWIYVRGILTLDLGLSHRQQRTVASLILERLPATLLLTGTAFAFALAAGIALGARRRPPRRPRHGHDHHHPRPRLLRHAHLLGRPHARPHLQRLARLAPKLRHGHHRRRPPRPRRHPRCRTIPHPTLPHPWSLLHGRLCPPHPAPACWRSRTRTSSKPARAKGVPEGRILRRHILRNALLPVITFAGIQAGQLIGGSILVETVFAWPGIGRLAFEALLARDYQVLLGVFLCTSILVVLFNLLTDLVYLVADPRMEVA